MKLKCAALLIACALSLSVAGCVFPADTTDNAGSLSGTWRVISDTAGTDGRIAPAEHARSFSILSQSDRLFLASWDGMPVSGGLFNQNMTRLIFDAGTPEVRNLVYGMVRNTSLMLASVTYNRSNAAIGAESVLAVRNNGDASLPDAFSIAGEWKIVSAGELDREGYSSLVGSVFRVKNESDGVILGTFEVDILGEIHDRQFAGSLSYVNTDGSSIWYNVVTDDGEFWKLNAVRTPGGIELTFWTVAISESGSKKVATIKRVYTRDGSAASPEYTYPDMTQRMICDSLSLLSGTEYLTLKNSDAMVKHTENGIQHDGLLYLGVTTDGKVNNYWDMGQYLTYISPGLFATTSAASSRTDGSVMISEGWYDAAGKLAELHLASNYNTKTAEFTEFSRE
ncbi:MAG: hypothetical protein Q4Q04_05505 [Methanocorpusculum sp.]|nr:hypothetical protein [Methanocorpusculum sp.]